ncbi:MAG: uncharacterized protein KVP18_002999 [Porospora cf. gigantea A]|uniref:uncharacterized protein n=1 Tax=Porospora cf. gigantea A TaxID=2853593 RepID=UPI00355AA351|nr:MAG: hypothetical protein KVP18_002999 [Porospora cf. gigantea A]
MPSPEDDPSKRTEKPDEDDRNDDVDVVDEEEQDALLGQFFLRNPHIEAMRVANPEIARLFSDPETFNEHLRQIMNPRLRNEVIRSNDRAINNLNATPGGFNFLRQQYDAVQTPIYKATDAMAFTARRSRCHIGRMSVKRNHLEPNLQPLPNPWVPEHARRETPPQFAVLPPEEVRRIPAPSLPTLLLSSAVAEGSDDGFYTGRSHASSDSEVFFSDTESAPLNLRRLPSKDDTFDDIYQ